MSLDHGMLNLPLSKRGDIDTQLDRYKRDLAAKASMQRSQKATETRELKAKAKQALVDIKAVPSLLDDKAAKMDVTKPALTAQLTDWSKWQPANLLKLHRQWIEQPK